METSTITANCQLFSSVSQSWIYSRQNRSAWIIVDNKHEWRRKGQEMGSANGYEVANVRRTVFHASSLTSTSFSKVYNGVKSPGMIPPSTSGGITVSWFSIIYPHQVEKHNPDSPFNSLSLSCSPHVIVVLRTNMSYVCERRAANGRVLKSAHLQLQVRPVLWGKVVGA